MGRPRRHGLRGNGLPAPIPTAIRKGEYLLLFDPLDGSSNIDVNVSVGTIFSVLQMPGGRRPESPPKRPSCSRHQAGRGRLCGLWPDHRAGADGRRRRRRLHARPRAGPVRADPGKRADSGGDQGIRHQHVQPAPLGAPVQRYVGEMLAGKEGPLGKDYNMRWVASMVADVHRIMTRGGIFMYPMDSKLQGQGGKLRLMYEANPMALLVEQAGGAASTGRQRILDMQPGRLHQRVPVILGSKNEVRPGCPRPAGCRGRSLLASRDRHVPQVDMERRAFAGDRFGADVAAVPRNDRIGDGQADAVTCALVAAVQALERFEHPRGIGHVEADTVVAHGQVQATVVAGAGDGDLHPRPAGREPPGIAQQLRQQGLEQAFVADDLQSLLDVDDRLAAGMGILQFGRRTSRPACSCRRGIGRNSAVLPARASSTRPSISLAILALVALIRASDSIAAGSPADSSCRDNRDANPSIARSGARRSWEMPCSSACRRLSAASRRACNCAPRSMLMRRGFPREPPRAPGHAPASGSPAGSVGCRGMSWAAKAWAWFLSAQGSACLRKRSVQTAVAASRRRTGRMGAWNCHRTCSSKHRSG
jgi:hypothetical protein